MLQPSELKRPLKVGHGRFLTADMLRKFFTGFAPGEDKYRMFFWMLLETGMRIKECCAVQETDFAENYRKLTIVTCKNPQIRKVTLSPALARFVKLWCEFNRRRFMHGYIFPVPNNLNQHVQPSQVRNFLMKKRKQLGLDSPVRKIVYKKTNGWGLTEQKFYALSCHSFRRFYETHLCNLSGGNYMLIASIMKYDDPGIVRKYYDDMQAVTMQDILSEQYHQRISSQLVQDRPILPKKQKTLGHFSGEEEKKNVWSDLQKYPPG